MEQAMTDDRPELELTHSAPLLDCDPVSDAAWPLPQAGSIRCEQINITPAMRELLTCKNVSSIPGAAPVDPRSRAEKIIDATRRLLFGERSV
jgi:hypothetical protein